MENLKEKVLNTIKKYRMIEAGDKIVLGVSGGPDSICMLNVLKDFVKNCQLTHKLSVTHIRSNGYLKKGPSLMAHFEIVVAHVNHMIREEASEDEEYVRQYCVKNDIEFYSKSIDVQKLANTNKIGTEEAGRLVRYEFFDEVLKKTNANKVAIAHNKNDKIETILMHALRGCGIEGLKGIEPKRGNIIRPLIECEREEIEKYCDENKLNPRIDKTNFENIYTRNKVRNVVIPYIRKEFNPNIIETIDRLSDIISQEDEYIENQTQQIYNKILIETKLDEKSQDKIKEIIIDLKSFNLQEKVIKSRIIRYIIKRLFGSSASIEKIHIEDIIKLCDNNIGNKYLTPNKNVKVLVKNHKIYFMNQV